MSCGGELTGGVWGTRWPGAPRCTRVSSRCGRRQSARVHLPQLNLLQISCPEEVWEEQGLGRVDFGRLRGGGPCRAESGARLAVVSSAGWRSYRKGARGLAGGGVGTGVVGGGGAVTLGVIDQTKTSGWKRSHRTSGSWAAACLKRRSY